MAKAILAILILSIILLFIMHINELSALVEALR